MSRPRSDASPNPDPNPPAEAETAATSSEPSPLASVLFQEPTSDPEPAWTTGQEAPSSSSPSPSPDAGGGDSPRPSTDGRGLRARARAMAPVFAKAVMIAGGLAHDLLTREGTAEREAGLYLPDDEDVDAISTPLASLASRRAPEGAENPDVSDLAQLALGVVGYVVKQRVKLAQLRDQFRGEQLADDQAAAGQPEPDYPATRPH